MAIPAYMLSSAFGILGAIIGLAFFRFSVIGAFGFYLAMALGFGTLILLFGLIGRGLYLQYGTNVSN